MKSTKSKKPDTLAPETAENPASDDTKFKFLSHIPIVILLRFISTILIDLVAVTSNITDVFALNFPLTVLQKMAQQFFSPRVHALDFFSSTLDNIAVLTTPKLRCLQFLLG